MALLVAAGLLMSACVRAFAGAPIPRTVGDIGWELATAGAPMTLEIFGDFQCPDTKAAWEGWLQPFRKAHSDAVSIVFRPFPLPYHKNGFDAAQAAYVMMQELQAATSARDHQFKSGRGSSGSSGGISGSTSGDFIKVADALFAAQAAFQTDVTVNISQAQLFSTILAPIAAGVGVDKATFLSHMNNDDPTNEAGRVAWKAGCARGVSGTPTFAANGVVSDELASWNLTQWEAWLSAGFENKRVHRQL